MEPTVELTFHLVDSLYHVGATSLMAMNVYFKDIEGIEYALSMQISIEQLRAWSIPDEDKTKITSILFQAAEEKIDEMIWGETLGKYRKTGSDVRPVLYRPESDEDKCPFEINRPLPVTPFTRIFWKRQGTTDIEKRQEERMHLLQQLYEFHSREPNKRVGIQFIGLQLGLSTRAIDSACKYLLNEGRIQKIPGESKTPDTFVMITHKGVKQIENVISEPSDKSPQPNVINVGQMIGSQIQQGSHAPQVVNTSGEKGVEETNGTSGVQLLKVILAVISAVVLIGVFELLVQLIPWPWLCNHSKSYGLQAGICVLIAMGVIVSFFPRCLKSKWFWRVMVLPVFLLVLSLLGGPSK